MIEPEHTMLINATGLRLDDFTRDLPQRRTITVDAARGTGPIDGVMLTSLNANSDQRGSLRELLTTRDGSIEPLVHVYQVIAQAGSIRAWVYHRRQSDRLAFCEGSFEVALYDIRPQSPTINQLVVFRFGSERPARLTIPPLVIHGVMNIGHHAASFVNMPTQPYVPSDPDKYRLAYPDPRIPYQFNVR
jgi:dTDP-4-dehydrorhamnose 3,5-epimerase